MILFEKSADARAPAYKTDGANGFDLCSVDAVELRPGERALVGTGLKFELRYPECLLVLPRSGLAWEHGVTVLNAPGLVDSDYRGEVKVILMNVGANTVNLPAGSRIAQGVITQIWQVLLREVKQINKATERGERGFGHTGV
jgi:dUTP pyrophosphatase